jgi:hypothetical protein
MIIVNRATMEDDLQLFGDDPQKVLIASQSEGVMTIALFAKPVHDCFFLMIEDNRARSGCQGRALSTLSLSDS